jgi:hypothetical protein
MGASPRAGKHARTQPHARYYVAQDQKQPENATIGDLIGTPDG